MTRVRGWCPSAHRPMMSGDGLLVRVKPWMGQLSAGEVGELCQLAARYGSGLIDLTTRANLQFRGVAASDHEALLAELVAAGLVEADPEREARRNLVCTPFWQEGDLTWRLSQSVMECLDDLPALPGKMGIAIDTSDAPMLRGVPADFRFERSEGGLILRADGAPKGRVIDEGDAGTALIEMAEWFITTGGQAAGRMARHLSARSIPSAWQVERPKPDAERPVPGTVANGHCFGVSFGRTKGSALAELMTATSASYLRVTPWRLLFLEGAGEAEVDGYYSSRHPILDISACPGAPDCAQASVETRRIAARLSELTDGGVHVSGCAKGCASPQATAITLVGNGGHFDLVRDGRAGDEPAERGLSANQVLELLGQRHGI